MTIYTAMPLELVLDGIQNEPGPFVEVTVQGVTMQLTPVAPGIGKIVRLLSAPLDCYLLSEYSPGRTICYYPAPGLPSATQVTDFEM
jgi:hypothetical protein